MAKQSSPAILNHRRAELEARIEELIALLDLVDGDCDLEENGDLEPSLHPIGLTGPKGLEYDLEDDTSDAEPFLGWSEFQSKHSCLPTGTDEFGPTIDSLKFEGDGYHIGREILREKLTDPHERTKALHRTRVSPGYGRHVR